MNVKHLALTVAALSLATAASAQVTHFRGADGALYITDPNPGIKPPVAHVGAFSSPHATCGQAGTAAIGMGVRIDRCTTWVFGPTRTQQKNFGTGRIGDSQFVSRPAL